MSLLVQHYCVLLASHNPILSLTLTPTPTLIWRARGRQGRSRGSTACFHGVLPASPALDNGVARVYLQDGVAFRVYPACQGPGVWYRWDYIETKSKVEVMIDHFPRYANVSRPLACPLPPPPPTMRQHGRRSQVCLLLQMWYAVLSR